MYFYRLKRDVPALRSTGDASGLTTPSQSAHTHPHQASIWANLREQMHFLNSKYLLEFFINLYDEIAFAFKTI